MDELKARYLRQQMELGGEEVILSKAAGQIGPVGQGGQVGHAGQVGQVGLYEPAGRVGPGGRVGRVPSAPPVSPVPSDSSSSAPSAPPVLPVLPASSLPVPPASSQARWRENLPPIPGPGLTIRTPDTGLLGDEFTVLDSLEAAAARIATCVRCNLCSGRTRTVPGEGHPQARLMFVGEGPGATEDETGRPFVGAAGQLLDKILDAIECPRQTVFIANIVKCRPPQNRKPLPDEMAACLPYLHRQIALIAPKVLVALGSTAAEGLLGVRKSLGELRTRVHHWNGIPLIITYHPAALLRNPNWKKPAWDDIRIARQLLGD